LIAATRHNRRGMGAEQNKEYVDITYERIRAFYNGTLKLRPIGKPVYQPTGREKVSQVPEEWNSSS
jgi:hypothetical protein